MKKVIALMPLWLSAAAPCLAQGAMSGFVSNEEVSPANQLFQLNPEQYNHEFQFALPNDGQLKINFLRLSDWGEKNQLKAITDAAAKQVTMLRDSFKHDYSAKLLAMNIPIDGQTIAISYTEDDKGQRQLAYKNDSYYQLKTSFDTVRIVKNMGLRTKPLTDSGLVQVQYTFILKDINDIISLSENRETMENLGTLIDAEVNKYRDKWSRQDARIHHLNLKYDPVKNRMERQDQTSGLFGYLDIYLGIGATTYTNNALSPYFEESIAFRIPSRAKMQPFVGANVTGFGYFNLNGSQGNYTTYNFEFGYCKRAAFMPQKTSIMLGLMRVKTPNADSYNMFHMGFTLGFNSFLSGGFFIGTDFKKNSSRSLLGVNFKFNL